MIGANLSGPFFVTRGIPAGTRRKWGFRRYHLVGPWDLDGAGLGRVRRFEGRPLRPDERYRGRLRGRRSARQLHRARFRGH